MFMPRSFALVALLALLPLQGCDETSGLRTADDLVTDARIARQAGDLDQAVTLLEDAFAADASDPVVRTELASTLFQQEGLDLADIDRIAEFLLQNTDGLATPAAPATAAKGANCPYEEDASAEPFDPRDLDGYIEYVESDATIDRVLELLAPIIAAELRPADFLCTGIVDGELNYDADGALQQMRDADPEMTDELIAAALAVNASARLLSAYNFVVTDIAPLTDWYRLDGGALGVCMTGTTEAKLREMSAEAVADIGEALTSVDLRARVLDNPSSTAELVQLVLDAYEEVRSEIGPYCEGV